MNRMTAALAACLAVSQVAFSAPLPVELFSPQGQVKKVRQVTARFAEQMVPFGDPRELSPFEISCPEKGQGRWADGRNWVYDFEQDLPAGVNCTFRLRPGLKSLPGNLLASGQSFSFNTGGPAIVQNLPNYWEQIDEEQVFILGLDAPAKAETIAKNAWCSVGGINEPIPVKLLTGEKRRMVLDARKDFMEQYYRAIAKIAGHTLDIVLGISVAGSEKEKFLKMRDDPNSPIVVLQCQRPFPNEAQASLMWGAGIESLSGIASSQPQSLSFRVRPGFTARFHCERVNKDAQCTPVLPMSLDFSAPIRLEDAKRIQLVVGGAKRIKPTIMKNDGHSGFVQRLSFNPPFPPSAKFRLELPPNLRDDSGRTLTNAAHFPLEVHTDEDPPLVKFAANFGILERNASPALPVTLRNVEPELAARMAAFKPASDTSNIGGSIVVSDQPRQIIAWMKRLQELRQGEPGRASLFNDQDKPKTFNLPKPGGQRAFEVVGIPLKASGFYVVELASPRLGAALLGDEEEKEDKSKDGAEGGLIGKALSALKGKTSAKEHKPYFVQSAVLVTNLAAHFKQGRESSLVWVTSLDKGEPVAGADVAVRDCSGRIHWQGTTDAQGLAHIAQALPDRRELPGCVSSWDKQYFVTARLREDFTFVLSDWNEGIAPWRFELPQGDRNSAGLMHAVLDRMLFRAGETAHMKLFARRHTKDGFSLPERADIEGKLIIQHAGSAQEYELSLSWDSNGIAEADFAIPQEAKQGIYLLISRPKNSKYGGEPIGSFRVEAYRVPTMRAVLTGPEKPLVNAEATEMDVQVSYLSGGAAAMLPVKLRSQVLPKNVRFSDYEGFVFANGGVKAGKVENSQRLLFRADDEEYEEDAPSDDGDGGESGKLLKTQAFNLDASGASRTTIADLPRSETPQELRTELEYRDANGEVLTSSSRVALWPSEIIVGVKPDSWVSSRDHLKFQLLVLNLAGKPVEGTAVKVDVLQREHYSHRRRLIGGFYAYEHGANIKLLKTAACEGKVDAKGLLFCDIKPPASGNLIVVAEARDNADNIARANREIWVAGSDDWWYEASDNDRMDVLPEKKRYEPGEMARFQVRTPFADATALVTMEREGIMESFVTPLSRKNPVIEVPIKGNYAPNVFVSVMAVRGRIAGPAPTALVDLAKPAFRLGMAEINVGWAAHELKVKVAADRPVYRVRDKATVSVEVRGADGGAPPKGSEIALAAVDEGLLELLGNNSWQLLDAMMKRRGIEVTTATAQMQVVGKRHFGRKSIPAGGGGGRKSTRELFDTLLFWKARIKLDDKGRATVGVPLNDSLTSFRIVAVANGGPEGGTGLFGTGESTIQSTQELMLISGLPPLVREQDNFRAGFTVRNTSGQKIELTLTPSLTASSTHQPLLQDILKPQELALNAGEAREFGWDVEAPIGVDSVDWLVKAEGSGAAAGASDVLKITQKIQPAVSVRTFQATIAQLDKPLEMNVSLPKDAIPGRGGIHVQLQSRLADELPGVREYMSRYPYTCLEQKASVAIALRDEMQWDRVMANLPAYLDRDGMAKYFPMMDLGSDTLTSYLLSIAHEAGYEIPEASRSRMESALIGFIEGRIVRYSSLPVADLAIRKLAALAALSRGKTRIDARWLDGFSIEPNLWPTSAVLDWYSLLKRAHALPQRSERLDEAEQIIRSRLNFQGTTMGFSTERTDALWWLMTNADTNANRIVLEIGDKEGWHEDMPRLVRGSLGRQHQGRWDTTVANAWGVLAMEKFSKIFEATSVTGKTSATLGDKRHEHAWSTSEKRAGFTLPWPSDATDLGATHEGTGRPWIMVQSQAAIPLKESFSSGYRITRTVKPVEQQRPGEWNRGDVLRVRLDLEAQSDMTWVVVNDPIPAGSAILGTGLGKDSEILTTGEKRKGWVWPAFEERTLDSFRAYYEFVPKGKWTVEYTLRLNNGGRFKMPETRVEAMYAPEMFGEIPNQGVVVKQ